MTDREGRAGRCNLHAVSQSKSSLCLNFIDQRVQCKFLQLPRHHLMCWEPNYCGDYSSCTQPVEQARQGSLLRLSISGVTSQHPTSVRHPTMREAVRADKVIWLGGALSSAPTAGYLGLLGILSAHPHISPLTVTIAPLCWASQSSYSVWITHTTSGESTVSEKFNHESEWMDILYYSHGEIHILQQFYKTILKRNMCQEIVKFK